MFRNRKNQSSQGLARARQLIAGAKPPRLEQLEDRTLLSLLGIGPLLEPPQVSYDATGLVAYNASTEIFSADAVPVTFTLVPGQRPITIQTPRDVDLAIQVDNTGALVGGVAGDDLTIVGQIDVNRDGIMDYDGVLLTAEIVAFGFLNVGNTDQYDFRLVPTGGDLMPFFVGNDVGMVMTSPNSTFTGSFAQNFGGDCDGRVGVIDMLAADSSLAGLAFHDSNDNSQADEGEAGISGVAVALTGTDYRGSAVSLSLATGADGSYAFTGLRPGTYSILETQPAGYMDSAAGVNSYANLVVPGGFTGGGCDFAEILPSSLAGSVYMDANDNGVTDGTEAGLTDVTVRLTGIDDRGNAVNLVQTTDASGGYAFSDLRPGTYAIGETQPAGYLSGVNSVGSLGGVLSDDVVGSVAVLPDQNGTGYNFAELAPSSLSGFVWEDFNGDGEIDFSEKAITGTTVTLTGVDSRGNVVSATSVSDADGVFVFTDLRPGTYAITETQPAGYTDGADSLGTLGGTVTNDAFGDIAVGVGVDGVNYNFGERPLAGSAVTAGQTATIGFWQNKKGQAMIQAMNGGPAATQLGNWLAATFPNMYASLAGATNAQIAAFYRNMFTAKIKGTLGPAKFDCQVMATAFAVYVTNASLAGNTATQYGFLVTGYGVGIATFNVGTSGAAFGVADNAEITVLDILLATNERSIDGRLYDMDALLRRLANEIYTAINESGHIA